MLRERKSLLDDNAHAIEEQEEEKRGEQGKKTEKEKNLVEAGRRILELSLKM